MRDELRSVHELAETSRLRFPNESDEYRAARIQLLAEEIELRRHIERVAQIRRNLPEGGALGQGYVFDAESGSVTLTDLFGDKDTLIIYSMMYGPDRLAPCPMCTALLTSWDGTVLNLRERVSIVISARSPLPRLQEFRTARDFRNLQFVSDGLGDFTADYVSPSDADIAGLSVFVRLNGTIRHFWSVEMTDEMADPGQDLRGAPDADPLWTILDMTPGGRGSDWYPQLEYKGTNLVTNG